jgi:putative addiction module component (TIGR02574 family)
MARTADEVYAQVLELSEEERAKLDAASWDTEIGRRIEDYRSGRDKGIPAEEVFRELRAS